MYVQDYSSLFLVSQIEKGEKLVDLPVQSFWAEQMFLFACINLFLFFQLVGLRVWREVVAALDRKVTNRLNPWENIGTLERSFLISLKC